MKRNTLKFLAFASAIAVSGFISGESNAQTTSNVPVTLTTSSAITVTAGNPMDFGTWLLLHPSASGTDDFTVILAPLLNTRTANAAATSTAVEIVAGATAGSLTVQTPAAATVKMYGAITDFASTALTLASPTYSFNGGANAALSIVPGTPTTIAATGAADTLLFGGTLTVTGTPADAAHTATLAVTFSY